MKINYKLATTTWDAAEYKSILRVIKSKNFTMGSEVAIYEKQFADFFNKKFAVMVNSGSSANLLMIASLFYRKSNPLKEGDEIIVPSVSWSTTYMPLQQYKLKVKFIDIDLHTLNYNLDALSKAIGPNTKAIIAVNLLGNPNNFNVIKQIIDNKNILLLEDNCESMGAKFHGQYTGAIGLMGTFSSFYSHHISTMEGGMIITDDEELYQIMLSLRAHGWTRNLPKNNLLTGIKSDNLFEESYKFILPGYNLRPLELSGAIGQEQLKKLNTIVENRRNNAFTFKQIISKYDWLIPQQEIGESSWFGFSLIVNQKSSITRQKLINSFHSTKIEYRPIVAGNFAKNSVIKYFDSVINEKLENADYIDRNGLFIGNHHYDLTKEFGFLIKALNKIK